MDSFGKTHLHSIGDVIRIRREISPGRYYNVSFTEEMTKYRGMVGSIESYTEYGYILSVAKPFSFTDPMIETISIRTLSEKEKLSYLKILSMHRTIGSQFISAIDTLIKHSEASTLSIEQKRICNSIYKKLK